MKKSILFICAIALISACTTPGKRTAIGAAAGTAVGAGAGALISKATGGSAKTGALIGAAAGLTTGGLIGNYYDKQAKELAAIADVTKDENGIKVTLKNDILFETGSAVLSDAAKQNLINLNRVLEEWIMFSWFMASALAEEAAEAAAKEPTWLETAFKKLVETPLTESKNACDAHWTG